MQSFESYLFLGFEENISKAITEKFLFYFSLVRVDGRHFISKVLFVQRRYATVIPAGFICLPVLGQNLYFLRHRGK